jgi:hypothetical protein
MSYTRDRAQVQRASGLIGDAWMQVLYEGKKDGHRFKSMIGIACNSQIPQANLHAVLNFVHAKAIVLLILESFES